MMINVGIFNYFPKAISYRSMPENKSFNLRIEIIDECLRNNYRKWTLADLLKAVNRKLNDSYGKNASRRTLQDDLKHLKEHKDAPIKKTREGNKIFFYYENLNFSIRNLPIKDEEINLLNDAINILREVSDFKILSDVDAIINKLQNRIQTNSIGSAAIIQFEKHTKVLGMEYIDDIFVAIKHKSALRITYQSFKSLAPYESVFHPYLLKEYRNRWFVIGRQEGKKKLINFALDRIKKIRNSSKKYQNNDLNDMSIYFDNLIGVTLPRNGTIEEIDIKVSSIQTPYIVTKPIHNSQRIIKEYQDGSIVIRLELIINEELKSVLLGYGNDIEVLRPTSLRENMKTIFKHGFNSYS